MRIFLVLIGIAFAQEGFEREPYERDCSMSPECARRHAAEVAADQAAKKHEKARVRQRRLCDGGAAWACYQLGKDPADPSLLRRACDGGVAPACTAAGRATEGAAARRWYRRGCRLGDLEACDAL